MGVLLNPTTLHFHFHPLYLQSTKRPVCWTVASVTILLALSSSTCPNCQCVCVRPLKWPSQMPDDECSSTRGGTIKDSREGPKGVLGISDLSIKIERGPNISTLKDNPWGSPFKTRAGCSRRISWCCPAEVTIVVYLSCDEWPILIWFQWSGQPGATTWPTVWPVAHANMFTSYKYIHTHTLLSQRNKMHWTTKL